MTILDRYIIKKLLVTFFSILGMLTVIIGTIDFLNKHDFFAKAGMGSWEIIDYYGAFLAFLINFLTPIIIFISVIFITSFMAQRSEIIAILSSGITYRRFMRPYIMVASLIAVMSFILMGWVLAHTNKKRIDYEDRLGFNVFFVKPQYIHLRISKDEYLFMENYRSMLNTGTNVTIEKIIDGELVEKTYACTVLWLDDTKTWELGNWVKRELRVFGEKMSSGESFQRDLFIDPSDLNINPRLYETLPLPELHAHISDLRLKQSDALRFFLVEMYIRYMVPFAAIILTVMGVSLSSYRPRRGAGIQLSFGLLLAFTYIFMFLFSRGYAEASGTNLLFTIWFPNLLFGSICYLLYRVVPK